MREYVRLMGVLGVAFMFLAGVLLALVGNDGTDQCTVIFSNDRGMSPQKLITIGTGTGTDNPPLDIYYGHHCNGAIYLQSELGPSCKINKIRWYRGTASADVINSVKIYMSHTTLSTFASNPSASSVQTGTLVWSGDLNLDGTTSDWYPTITLSTPFQYNGVDNLIVSVRQDDDSYESVYSTYRYTSTSPNYRFASWSSDSNIVDPTLTRTYNRPNIQLDVTSLLTSPTGGEHWKGGSTHSVTWDITESTGPFSIWANYSTDSGATYPNTISGIQGASQGGLGPGSGSWTLPVIDSTTCRVQLEVYNSTMVKQSDASGSDFTIDSTAPTVVSTDPPNLATGVKTSKPVSITFSEAMDNAAAQSAFSCAPDPGGWSWTWNAANTTMTGTHNAFTKLMSYSCSVGTAAADLAGNNLASTYTWGFQTADSPTVYVLKPNGGEGWPAASSQNILWYVSGGTLNYQVWLNYSTDGGVTYGTCAGAAQPVTQTFAGSSSYSWNLPATPSTNCLVKVSVADAGMQTGEDTSNSTFDITLAPSVKLLKPNGGEYMAGGSNFGVSWNVSYGMAPYTYWLNYSTDGGATYNKQTPAQADTQPSAGPGTYTWSVPGTGDETQVRMKIDVVDGAGTKFSDTSDNNFVIDTTPPTVASTLPADGATKVAVDTNIEITFNEFPKQSSGTNGSVSVNPSAPGTVSFAGATLRYDPTSSLVENTTYTVTVSTAMENLAGLHLASPYTFTFTTKKYAAIDVVTPNGGETLHAGTFYNITWTGKGSGGPSNITLRYSTTGRAGPQGLIKEKIPYTGGPGSYQWTVPNVASTDCFVNITLIPVGDPSGAVIDDSDNAFTILGLPVKIHLVTPNGGENWTVGTSRSISWNMSGGAATLHVSLNYSVDGGSSYLPIAPDITGTSYYSWIVSDPGATKTSCLVNAAITDGSSTANDGSDNVFTIYLPPPPPLSLDLQSPLGGEYWDAGTTQLLAWMVSGGRLPYSPVSLEYSLTGMGGAFTPLTTTKNTTYNWGLPVLTATAPDCYVRATVNDNSSQTVTVANTVPFTIVVPDPPTIEILSPNGKEVWGTNTSKTIDWTLLGGVEPISITLKYSTTGPNGTYTQIAVCNSSSSTYAWIIPDTAGTNCYVMASVKDSYSIGRTAEDKSDAKFTIIRSPPRPVITLNSPIGGERWSIGYDYMIRWSRTGGKSPFSTIIDYSVDGKKTYSTITGSATDAGISCSYKWNIPSTPSKNCYLKISLTEGSGQYAEALSGQFEITKDEPPGVGTIQGKVYYDGGSPVVNITVVLVDDTKIKSITNENGEFFIDNVPEGKRTIKVSKSGYDEVVKSGIVVTKNQVTDVGTLVLMKSAPYPKWMNMVLAIVVLVVILAFVAKLAGVYKRGKKADEEKPAPVWIHPPPPAYGGYGQQQGTGPLRGGGTLPTERIVAQQDTRAIDRDAELLRLKQLRAKGMLSEEEFNFTYSRLSEGQTETALPQAVPLQPTATEWARLDEKPPEKLAKPKPAPPPVDEREIEQFKAREKEAEESGDIVSMAFARAERESKMVGREADTGPKKELDIMTLNKLARLEDMRSKGLISQEDYENTKKELRGE